MGKATTTTKQTKLIISSGLGKKFVFFILIGLSPQVTKETVIKGKVVPLIFQEVRC